MEEGCLNLVMSVTSFLLPRCSGSLYFPNPVRQDESREKWSHSSTHDKMRRGAKSRGSTQWTSNILINKVFKTCLYSPNTDILIYYTWSSINPYTKEKTLYFSLRCKTPTRNLKNHSAHIPLWKTVLNTYVGYQMGVAVMGWAQGKGVMVSCFYGLVLSCRGKGYLKGPHIWLLGILHQHSPKSLSPHWVLYDTWSQVRKTSLMWSP